MKISKLMIPAVLLATSVSAEAGQTKFTESLSDAVTCSRVDGETSCGIETKGKYSGTAYISADTFDEKGVTFDTLSDASTIEIQMGEFAFSSTIGEAVSHTLTSTKLNAKWQITHDVCNSKDVCKPVVDTTVTVAANTKGVTIKVSGASKSSDNDSFGQSMYAGACEAIGDGEALSEPISLTVDGIEFATTMNATCKVKYKTVTKNGEEFSDLRTISISGKADYLD